MAITKPAPPPIPASITEPTVPTSTVHTIATTCATAITPTITSCSIKAISQLSPKFPFLVPSISSKISSPHCQSQCDSTYWIPELFLYHSDKCILFFSSASQWLNDAIVNGAQMLLKQQADSSYLGFQSTLLGKVLQFKVVKREKPLVQILHVNNHWVTATTVDCASDEIRIYDSLYNYISFNLKQQICSFLRPKEHSIKFLSVDMQQQEDTNSCGLFAIAVATELVAGGSPTTCKWDVEKMRQHLKLCFQKKELTEFPKYGERRVHPASQFKQVVKEKIHCECRMPRDPRNKEMIECVKCMQLFHKECCGVGDLAERGKYWACSSCK